MLRAGGLGIEPCFDGSIHTNVLNLGTQLATLPSACHYKVSVRTGWLGVSVL